MGPGAWKKLKLALSRAGINTIHVLRLRWPWLLLILTLSLGLKEYFAYFSGNTMPGADMERLVGRLGEMSTDMFVSVLVLFVAPITALDVELKRPLTSVWKLSNKHIYDLTVESLRVLTSVLIWALALIIPGVYRSLQFSFFPFVVMFDEKYINEEVDCLERSLELIKGILFTVFAVGMVSLGIDLALKSSLQLFASAGPLLYAAKAGISLLTLVLSVYTLLVSFHLYRQQTGEEKGE